MALLLVAACSSHPTRRQGKRLSSVHARSQTAIAGVESRDSSQDACQTVLDCMRTHGSPAAGLTWTCHLGQCTPTELARPIASH